MESIRFSGFSDALDWRPILFLEPTMAQCACALCGVLLRRAVRLSCGHVLCSECHEESDRRGGTCPLDDVSFCDDNFVRLDIPENYLGKRQVACWNMPNGCNFVGPTCSLLEHYKDCTFHVVSCPRCHSSVLRSGIVAHCKDNCSASSARPSPDNISSIVNCNQIERASNELKEAVGKLSEELSSLHTGLNQCREDIREAGERSKEQLKTESATICELFMQSRNAGPAATVSRPGEGAGDAGEAVRDHWVEKSVEIVRLPTGTRGFSAGLVTESQWEFKGLEVLKKRAMKGERAEAESAVRDICGYKVSCVIIVGDRNSRLHICGGLRFHPGELNSRLKWPFRRNSCLSILNSMNDQRKVLWVRGLCKDAPHFQRPEGEPNEIALCSLQAYLFKLEEAGFVENNTLHLSLEMGD